ncbi:MAG: hypothetical protein PHR77_19255 [Kiritimatiellae bacterium]|nr:hypothetical protein [Kiritimatiellia bacterium]MDD5521835.1 hypothetical protein [Kiritimatiellia bacterium]
MKKLVIILMFLSVMPFMCFGKSFETVPIQLSLFDPVQLFSYESDVMGIRLNVPYGFNRNVYGIDVGLCNDVQQTFAGISVGGFVNFAGEAKGIYLAGLGNITERGMRGLEIAGFMNLFSDISTTSGSTWKGIQLSSLANASVVMRGVQICGFGNMADDMKGVELAGIGNFVDTFSGLQFAGLVNLGWNVEGAQISALYNRADKMNGLQFGLINRTRQMHGIQIGLLNMITDNLSLSVIPLVNGSF